MLTIRNAQLEVFEREAMASYRRELLEHYRTFAPALFRAAKEDAFRAFIDYGTRKAAAIGLTLRGPMRLFVDMMCILGHEFDRDVQYRRLWPEGDPAAIPMPFAQRLHANLGEYLEQCVGENNAILRRALSGVVAMPPAPEGAFAEWTRGQLEQVYPEKLAYMGEEGWRGVLAQSAATALQLALVSPRGHLVVVILTVGFGVDFISNPLYPWIRARLWNEAHEDVRVERTVSALHRYATHMQANLSRGE